MNNRIKTILTLVALLLGSANAYSKDALQVGERLNTNESLSSLDGRYRFILQGDGNLVLRNAAERHSGPVQPMAKGSAPEYARGRQLGAVYLSGIRGLVN